MGTCEQGLKTLAQQLEDDRAAVDGVERQRRAKQARLEAVKQSQKDVDSVTSQLDEVGEEYKMYKDVVRELRGKQSTIEQCEGDMATLDAKKKVGFPFARPRRLVMAPSRPHCCSHLPRDERYALSTSTWVRSCASFRTRSRLSSLTRS